MEGKINRWLSAAMVFLASILLAVILVYIDLAGEAQGEVVPTATPVQTGEDIPTAQPTPVPTPQPTSQPTPVPTPELTPEPTPESTQDPEELEGQVPAPTPTNSGGSRRNKTYSETRYNSVVKQVLDKILTDGMTPREQCRAIHKYVKYHVTYTGSSDKSDWKKEAYSGFVNATGDCYTYYACCRALLTELGIDNMEIQRYGSTMPSRHYWNLVNYGEGWYHMDACPHLLVDPAFECFMATDQELINFSAGAGRQYYYFDFDSPDYPERVGGGVDWDNIQPMPDRRPKNTPTPTPEVTATPVGAPTTELAAEPAATPTTEPTAEPVATPTAEPTAEPVATPTAEPTAEPVATPTAEPAAEPVATPTAEPAAEPTATPTAEPAAEPVATPTAESAAEPTATPTAEPAAEPVATPTAEPTAEPVATPTAEPAAQPDPEPSGD